MQRPVNARVVDEDDLSILGGLDAQDAVSCCLGLVGYDCHFLSKDFIEQSGLSYVRPSD